MSALDRADRLRSVLERMHRPDVALSATRRRLDFITRPQEPHPMHDDRIIIDLQRDGDLWRAHAAPAAPELRRSPAGILHADARIDTQAPGPAAALEAVGQELDLREAERLTREARGETGPMTVEQAVERSRARDVASVLEVMGDAQRLALGDTPVVMTTLRVAVAAGFTAGAAGPGTVDEEQAAARARRALEQAVRDGVIVREADPRNPLLELWRVANDDEIEAAR